MMKTDRRQEGFELIAQIVQLPHPVLNVKELLLPADQRLA